MSKREAKIQALEWACRSLSSDAVNVFSQCKNVDLDDDLMKLYSALLDLSKELKDKADILKAPK